jgi:hypothetical protein
MTENDAAGESTPEEKREFSRLRLALEDPADGGDTFDDDRTRPA